MNCTLVLYFWGLRRPNSGYSGNFGGPDASTTELTGNRAKASGANGKRKPQLNIACMMATVVIRLCRFGVATFPK